MFRGVTNDRTTSYDSVLRLDERQNFELVGMYKLIMKVGEKARTQKQISTNAGSSFVTASAGLRCFRIRNLGELHLWLNRFIMLYYK